mgnify:FL=1
MDYLKTETFRDIDPSLKSKVIFASGVVNHATPFNKEEFHWDGMYLMYNGRHSQSINMEVVWPDCHPSLHGKPRPVFIARFKHGHKPWKAWVNFLVKNATVEEYIKLSEEDHPVGAMGKIGYKHQ